MKNFLSCRLLLLSLALSSFCFGQKLKKADRQITRNLQRHMTVLNSHDSARTKEKAYICHQFEHYGLIPKGTKGDWLTSFNIYEGKEILPATTMSVNGDALTLHNDYFPFCFSANGEVDTEVSVSLPEKGVPWFADLKEILEKKTDDKDTAVLIREKAEHAAAKGATALVIYNSDNIDATYDPMSMRDTAPIPVVYLKKDVYRKYVPNELTQLNIQLRVAMAEKERTDSNITAFADNGADSTIMISAPLDDPGQTAALLELARVLAASKKQTRNYLFVMYSGSPRTPEEKAIALLDLKEIKNISAGGDQQADGLYLVKHSLDMLR